MFLLLPLVCTFFVGCDDLEEQRQNCIEQMGEITEENYESLIQDISMGSFVEEYAFVREQEDMWRTIHYMANTKIVSERIIGWIDITEGRIDALIREVLRSDYDDKKKLLAILYNWKVNDFSYAVDEHNYVWSRLQGEVGFATGLRRDLDSGIKEFTITDHELRVMKNMEAFAKAYTYARYYYPYKKSDLEWEEFALYGVKSIMDVPDNKQLVMALNKIFGDMFSACHFSHEEVNNYNGMNKGNYYRWAYKGVESTSHYSNYRGLGKGFLESTDYYQELSEELIADVYMSMPLVALQMDLETITFKPPVMTRSKEDGFADLVVLWAVLSEFYPYAEELHLNWDRMLREALRDCYRYDFDMERVIKKFSESMRDAHFRVYNSNIVKEKSLPIRIDLVEGKLIASNSLVEAIRPGDRIIAINHVNAMEDFLANRQLSSGSEQWKNHAALLLLVRGKAKGKAILTYESHGKVKETELEYTEFIAHHYSSVPMYSHQDIGFKELEEGIYYINLMGDVDFIKLYLEHRVEFLKAKGFIFDVRGRIRNRNEDLLAYLITEDRKKANMCLMEVHGPASKRIPSEDNVYRGTKAKLGGIYTFLINEETMSLGETIPMFVKYHDIGPLIGNNTAGVNGDIHRTSLPSGLEVEWTEVYVRHISNDAFHGIGTEPDRIVERDLDAVSQEVDEYIDVALEYILETNN